MFNEWTWLSQGWTRMSAKPAAHDRYLHLETEEASRAPEDLKSASSVILRAVLASITTTTTHSCSLGVAYRAVPAGLPVLV